MANKKATDATSNGAIDSTSPPSPSTSTTPTNAEILKQLVLACAKEVLAEIKKRGRNEPADVGPGNWDPSTTIGPLEYEYRFRKALKLVTAQELADYLDQHHVVVLTADQFERVRGILDAQLAG